MLVTWVDSEVDVARLPFDIAVQPTDEGHGVTDVAEAKLDGAKLSEQSAASTTTFSAHSLPLTE